MSGGRRARRRVTAAAGSIPGEELAGSPSKAALISPTKSGDASALKSWLSARVEGLTSDADQTYSGFSKELDAAAGRFKKRLKLELESSSRLMDDANRAWKTFSSDFEEDVQEIQGACNAFVNKTQVSSSKSFAEVLKSAESQIENLRAKHARA